ncbi:hypothetical protein CF293_09400 [Campylobacter coli]|nr:hypothetical protein [Campylobacter coli]
MGLLKGVKRGYTKGEKGGKGRFTRIKYCFFFSAFAKLCTKNFSCVREAKRTKGKSTPINQRHEIAKIFSAMSAKPKEKKDETKLKFKMKFNRWGTLLLEKDCNAGA